MDVSDLGFRKDVADSERVLAKARGFLADPLTLPAYGQHAMQDLKASRGLGDLADYARVQLELPEAPPMPQDVRPAFLSKELDALPEPVRRAVRAVVEAGLSVRPALGKALPQSKPARQAVMAFALNHFHLDRKEADLQSVRQLGLDPAEVKDFLDRQERLELQEDETVRPQLEAADATDPAALLTSFTLLCRAVDGSMAILRQSPPCGAFEVSFDTPMGRVFCGGSGPNVYKDEAFLILDAGGDDRYEGSAGGANGLEGRPIAIVLDAGGDDFYASRRSVSQGAGLLGIGILADAGGNDVLLGSHLSQGAGLFGCGALLLGPGRQSLQAGIWAQGAGVFGAGILRQESGDTDYRASELCQACAGTSGCGLLIEEGGRDAYVAMSSSPCEWLPGQFFTLAQGFSIGIRPWAGGGVGILADFSGADRYVADVYGQGSSYWYSVGLLLDAEGNDVYTAHQYSQGVGIHLSSGALLDWAGDDRYWGWALCQGTAHDYAVGVLADRAGNDTYAVSGTGQGSALTNACALFVDRSGDDFYAGRDKASSQASGQVAGPRGYGCVAVLLDLGGDDVYSQGFANGEAWLKPGHGAGWDLEAVRKEAPAPALEHPRFPAAPPSPPRPSRPPVDPAHPVERLLRRAVREAETPDQAKDKQSAIDELTRRGLEVLPYLFGRLNSPDVLVRVRVEGILDATGPAAVPLLAEALKSPDREVVRAVAQLLSRFEDPRATQALLPLLEDEKTCGTALTALAKFRAKEALEPCLGMLAADPPRTELIRLRAAVALGRIRDARAVDALLKALDDPLWNVRTAAEEALVEIGEPAREPLAAFFPAASPRAKPYVVRALAALKDRRALTFSREAWQGVDPAFWAAEGRLLSEMLSGKP